MKKLKWKKRLALLFIGAGIFPYINKYIINRGLKLSGWECWLRKCKKSRNNVRELLLSIVIILIIGSKISFIFCEIILSILHMYTHTAQ